MECIIAYLLLGLFVDLLHALVTMADAEEDAAWTNRRLWSDHRYDCRSRPVRCNALVRQQPAQISCRPHPCSGIVGRCLQLVNGGWKTTDVVFSRRLGCRSVLR